MSIEVTLKYTEALVRDAALASWRRAFGFRFFAALLVTGASIVYLVYSSERSWLTGVAGTLFLASLIFSSATYIFSVRSSLQRLRQMQSPEAHFLAESGNFSISSSLGKFTLPWGSIKHVWIYPDFWLLVLSRTNQITIPLSEINEDARAFLIDRVQQAGGKIGG